MRISDGSSDGCSSDLHRARIVEVRLPLCLRRAQRVQYAVAAVDRDRAPAAREGDRLTDPVAGVGAAEDRVFENSVETAFGVVIRIAVEQKIVVSGKSVSGRVGVGGRRSRKNTKNTKRLRR